MVPAALQMSAGSDNGQEGSEDIALEPVPDLEQAAHTGQRVLDGVLDVDPAEGLAEALRVARGAEPLAHGPAAASCLVAVGGVREVEPMAPAQRPARARDDEHAAGGERAEPAALERQV